MSASRSSGRAAPGLLLVLALFLPLGLQAQQTARPVLHGKHWVAITGKPLAATAGAMVFQKGGNAVDAACAMIAATSTMWDTLGWGGETQALIYNPRTGKVVGINALGVAPSGATVDFYKSKGMQYPPEFGPLAAVTPGTPGGLLVMLAEGLAFDGLPFRVVALGGKASLMAKKHRGPGVGEDAVTQGRMLPLCLRLSGLVLLLFKTSPADFGSILAQRPPVSGKLRVTRPRLIRRLVLASHPQ